MTYLLISAFLLVVWVAKSLRFALTKSSPNVGRCVSGLLAGIVLVDLLALVDVSSGLAVVFVGLLLLAVYLQRFVPAT